MKVYEVSVDIFEDYEWKNKTFFFSGVDFTNIEGKIFKHLEQDFKKSDIRITGINCLGELVS